MGTRAKTIENHPLLPFDTLHPLLAWLHDQLTPDPFDRTVVVTTSEQAATSLCRGLLQRRRGMLGVHFVTAAGLARCVLQSSGARHPQRSPDPLVEREVLRGCLAEHPGELSRYAARYPGALVRLLAAIKELANAGWPEPESDLGPAGRELRAIGMSYRHHMAGWASRTRLMELAGEVASGDLPRRVLLAGYPHPERDLVRLLEHLENLGVEVRRSPTPADRFPAAARYSAPDIGAELRLAARLCLQAARDGIALTEMVVAAPSLGPYAAHLRRAFAAEGVPFTAKAEGSLLHEPRAAFYRHSASLLAESGRRASYMAVATSPLLRHPPLPVELDLLERLGRELSLQGNAAESTWFLETLGRELPGEARDGGRLLPLLIELRDAAAGPCSSAAEHIRRLRSFGERVLAPAEQTRDAQAEQRIAECFRALEEADCAVGDGGEFVSQLHDVLAQRGLPIRGGRGPGVAVVEHRDVLSFPAAHLHVLGLSADQVPGTNAAELLEPSDRERLPGLPSRNVTRDRQRELLQMAIRHPKRSLVLSFPRSTGVGRPGGPSPWIDALLAELPHPISEHRELAHPEARARRRVAAGLCPPDLALAHLAMNRAVLGDLTAVAGDDAAAWLRNRRLERFRPTSLAWDGDVGAELGTARAAAGLRVADLERLGRCPQEFLFSRLMKLTPLPREMDPLDLRRDLLGSLIHRVLQKVQEEFRAEMGAVPADQLAPQMSARAGELVRERWRREATALGPGVPRIRELLQERWSAAVGRAIEADLDCLAAESRRPEQIEQELRATLTVARPAAAPISLPIMGRADRIDARTDGSRAILDFKTGGKPKEPVDPKRILQGLHLQLVIYGMMLRATRGEVASALEIRPVHPVALAEGEASLQVPEDFASDAASQGVGETIAVLGELLLRGALVPNASSGSCAFCDFRLACRRLHPPSAERVLRSGVPEVRRYFALAGKSASRPLLDAEGKR